ncbi:MAG: TrkH family potassium uptake protein [Caulobacterales bacterium]|uniref:TrkH family potassium uptake protein n=1 Tax=Glycocaulis sp. TaxID=1969725 RepID=UPI003F9F6D18
MTIYTRTVIFILGVLLAALGAAMLVPAIIDLNVDATSAHAFFGSAVICGFVGGIMALAGRGDGFDLDPRGAILVTSGSWIVLSLAAAIPLQLSGIGMSWTDAIFESVSGITTTGATVLTGLQDLPAGILIWRAILQWIGGIGIIVTAMAIWPVLGIGGMQLFRLESSDKTDKALPRAGEIAGAVGLIYLVLTFACFIAYGFAGMDGLDAAAHAMTTVATGGFSTHDGSIGAWAHEGADLVALVFMLLAALPFLVFLRALQGRPDQIIADPQVRAFLITAFVACAVLTALLMLNDVETGTLPAWRAAAVNAVSVMTGTGFGSADFAAWGTMPVMIFFVLMFVGGCAGSSTCSIKIFRHQIAASAMLTYLHRYARPRAVRSVHYDGKPVPEATVRSVLGFVFLFFGAFAVSAILLSLIGLDPVTSLSGAATTIANVGPGLGEIIGPAGTFQPLPDAAKWVMSFTMLVGRLEVLTMLALFTPGFWRS